MKYQLNSKNYNQENSDTVLDSLLKERGIEDPVKWLHPNESYENSPWLFNEMAKAVKILNDTIKQKEKNIVVVVDSDVDGYTSGAIISLLLKQINLRSNVSYVLHPGKEHGIVLEDIPEDTDLIIVPDAGSSQKEEHLKLLNDNTKIIILDHHEISNNDLDYGIYKNSIAIVNSQEANYPNHYLSGAGVALKFVQAYAEQYGVSIPSSLYGLTAVGIVADVMDLRELENKQIVFNGLKYLKEQSFLYTLIKDGHYNEENPQPSVRDIGWIIGPNINAIIRLGTQEQKHLIFRALISPTILVQTSKRGAEEGEEVPLFEEAVRICKNAKKRQTTAVDKSIKTILSETEIKDNDNVIIYVDKNKELTFELSGLIANKLLSLYNRPVILLKPFIKDNIQEFRGSVRGKAVENLPNLKNLIDGISGVSLAEGHAFAFGLGVEQESFPTFTAHLKSLLEDIDFNTNLYLVDLITKYNELNLKVAKVMAEDNVWCHGVEKPLAVLTDIPVENYMIMGDRQQHLKINCDTYDIVLFGVPDLTEQLIGNKPFNLDVVGEFSMDRDRLQLVVTDYDLKPYVKKTVWDMVF